MGGSYLGKNFIGCFHVSEHVDHLEFFPLGKTQKLLGLWVPTPPPLFLIESYFDREFSWELSLS